MPASRSLFSGKLIHNLLTRILLTQSKHEVWFVFAGVPITYSLREYSVLTGLDCSPLNRTSIRPKPMPRKNEDIPEGGEHWKDLFGGKRVVHCTEIANMMRLDKELCHRKKLSLALQLIVEGIVNCNGLVVKVVDEIVELVVRPVLGPWQHGHLP
ncbi:hypothetical protein V5N11_011024 [Cardamine amara subsp. amara]|uniref:DUF1985 domain-containing protein n=1 Tax=Cardamine amara subsp. amara TaxID=228776 RepID=A0ABD1BVK2_CARAN